ncbi:DNA methyltransferase [Mycolicibacterium mageritense]|uniref:DNA methyltransferase n=1 Tax=Mycolicibacterium mageritense TaxID=53462 RepID=UPI002573EC23|nr:DNA methyltransferase [Mycolicibacterium mageritense]
MNRLYFGDNLEVLGEHVENESVDLVYLDPPFNSNRNYSVIFGRNRAEDESAAQIQAFEDTWKWTHTTEVLIGDLSNTAPTRVADALSAYYTLLGESEALAYLVNMTPRLLQLYRVLKPTGSLYLHCDPTMSHYLKVLLDAVFDVRYFRNEVVWKRTNSHNSAKRWGPQHDTLLFYTKSDAYTWNRTFQEYDRSYIQEKFVWDDPRGKYQDVALTGPGIRAGDSGKPWRGIDPTNSGRHWQPPSLMYDYYEELTGESLAGLPVQERLDRADDLGLIHWPKKRGGQPRFKQFVHISPGAPVQDMIVDIDPINSQAAERLGYPTQKPITLMERIITASSNPGDVVLDPFCGCGTTVDAAQRLSRNWIGIDITYLAVDVIAKRLRHTFGDAVFDTIKVDGIPKDLGGARALFDRSPLEFETWAVTMVNAEPNRRQVGDKGVDGIARFPLGGRGQIGKLVVSVKGGKTINPAMVRELSGAMDARKAQMGVLITMASATRGVTDAINHGGVFTHPANGQKYPRLQHITVADLLKKKRPQVPPTFLPYIAAQQQPVTLEQTTLFDTA